MSTSQPIASAGDFGQMQKLIEDMFLSRLALEQEVLALRSTQPVVLIRPPRASAPVRAVRRMLPPLRRRHHLGLIRACGLFDADWYLGTYRDVAEQGIDPAAHYLRHGATDLRNPGPHFDTAHYLHLYPDIAAGALNPLVHYIQSGIDEGRSIRAGMPHGRRT